MSTSLIPANPLIPNVPQKKQQQQPQRCQARGSGKPWRSLSGVALLILSFWKRWINRLHMKKRHEIHATTVKNFNNCVKQSEISTCAFEMSCRLLGVRFPRQLGTIGFWNYFGYLSSCFFCQHPFKQQLLTVLILSSSVPTAKRPKNPENYFKHHKLATDLLIHEGFTNSFSNPFRHLQENLNLMASCIYANRFTRSCRQMEWLEW